MPARTASRSAVDSSAASSATASAQRFQPPAIAEYRSMLAPLPVDTLGRFEFYDAARSPDLALAIVTADVRTYANLLLTIGVRAEGTLTTR